MHVSLCGSLKHKTKHFDPVVAALAVRRFTEIIVGMCRTTPCVFEPVLRHSLRVSWPALENSADSLGNPGSRVYDQLRATGRSPLPGRASPPPPSPPSPRQPAPPSSHPDWYQPPHHYSVNIVTSGTSDASH